MIFELSLEVNIGATHGKGRESAFQTLNGLCTKARRPDRTGGKCMAGSDEYYRAGANHEFCLTMLGTCIFL